jgi:hypothetical protein
MSKKATNLFTQLHSYILDICTKIHTSYKEYYAELEKKLADHIKIRKEHKFFKEGNVLEEESQIAKLEDDYLMILFEIGRLILSTDSDGVAPIHLEHSKGIFGSSDLRKVRHALQEYPYDLTVKEKENLLKIIDFFLQPYTFYELAYRRRVAFLNNVPSALQVRYTNNLEAKAPAPVSAKPSSVPVSSAKAYRAEETTNLDEVSSSFATMGLGENRNSKSNRLVLPAGYEEYVSSLPSHKLYDTTTIQGKIQDAVQQIREAERELETLKTKDARKKREDKIKRLQKKITELQALLSKK